MENLSLGDFIFKDKNEFCSFFAFVVSISEKTFDIYYFQTKKRETFSKNSESFERTMSLEEVKKIIPKGNGLFYLVNLVEYVIEMEKEIISLEQKRDYSPQRMGGSTGSREG